MTEVATDYSAMSDAALARAAGQGDKDAFRQIMQRCNQRLFRVARAIVANDDEAEDILQETYMRAYAALPRFRGDSSLLTWLTAIALNEARGRLRRRKSLVELQDMEKSSAQVILLHGAWSASDPEAETVRAEARRLLEAALDHLSSDHRVVFVLRDVEGLSEEETAAQLKLRVGTVKTRLHRARKALRQDLETKLSAGMASIFPFLGRRCARVTEKVLARLG